VYGNVPSHEAPLTAIEVTQSLIHTLAIIGLESIAGGKLAGMPHGFSTARAHRMDILRNFENRDLAVVRHSIARDFRNSYVYPSASPSRYENP
jgi:hypothetical protein